VLLGPVLVVAVLGLVLLWTRFRRKRNEAADFLIPVREQLRLMQRSSAVRSACLLILTLAYAQPVAMLLTVFRCTQTSQGRVLLIDPSISCTDSLHSFAVAGSIVALLAVGLGFPAVLFFSLRRLQKFGKLADQRTMMKYGFLYEVHSPSMPWFDAVIMLRYDLCCCRARVSRCY
jgi:hypothetical protein